MKKRKQELYQEAKEALEYIERCEQDCNEAYYGEYCELMELMFTAHTPGKHFPAAKGYVPNAGLTPLELVKVSKVAFHGLQRSIIEPERGLPQAPAQELVRCTFCITHAPVCWNVSMLKGGEIVLHQ